MKPLFFAAVLAAAATAAPAFGADVGISVSINQPGLYGRIDIGNVTPDVIYSQPVIVAPHPVEGPPIYLHVPPGYEKHWSRHCHEYHACGERVYFVQDKWYRHEYARHHREEYRDERRDDRGYDRGDDRGDDRGHDRGDDRRGGPPFDRGRGRGRDRYGDDDN